MNLQKLYTYLFLSYKYPVIEYFCFLEFFNIQIFGNQLSRKFFIPEQLNVELYLTLREYGGFQENCKTQLVQADLAEI